MIAAAVAIMVGGIYVTYAWTYTVGTYSDSGCSTSGTLFNQGSPVYVLYKGTTAATPIAEANTEQVISGTSTLTQASVTLTNTSTCMSFSPPGTGTYTGAILHESTVTGASATFTVLPPSVSESITLKPDTAASPLGGSTGCFEVDYTDPTSTSQVLTICTDDTAFVFNALAGTTVTISGTTTDSTLSDETCLAMYSAATGSCEATVILVPQSGPDTHTFYYYEALEQSLAYTTSDGSTVPDIFGLLYSTLPTSAGSTDSPLTSQGTSVPPLSSGAKDLWVLKGTSLVIGSPVYNYDLADQRWIISSADSSTHTLSSSVATSGALVPEYHHQLEDNLGYTVVGGGTPSAPTAYFFQFGTLHSATVSNNYVWIDSGSSLNYTNPLGGSTSSERWDTNWCHVGACPSPEVEIYSDVTAPSDPDPTYYNQYSELVSYSVSDSSSPTPPLYTIYQFAAQQSVTLSTTPLTVWADSGTAYSYTNPLAGSTSTERWISFDTVTGDITGSGSADILYYHQFTVTVVAAPTGDGSVNPSVSNAWENAGPLAVTASANSGFVFLQWSASTPSITFVSPSTASTAANVEGTGTITALFDVPMFGASLSPSSATMDSGGSVTFVAGALGGSGSHSYAWSIPSGISEASGCGVESFSCTVTSTTLGSYSVSVTVKDSGGGSVHPPSAILAVVTALSAGPISPGSPSISLGQPVTLASDASGGTPAYSYSWYTSLGCGGAPIGGATSSTYTATPSSTTTYYYKVTDSASTPESACSAGDTVTVGSASTVTTTTTATTSSSSVSTTTTTTTTSQGPGTTTTSQGPGTTTTSSATGNGSVGIPEFPFQTLGLTLLTAAMAAGYFLARRGLRLRAGP